MKFGCNLREVCISEMTQKEFILFTKGKAKQIKVERYFDICAREIFLSRKNGNIPLTLLLFFLTYWSVNIMWRSEGVGVCPVMDWSRVWGVPLPLTQCPLGRSVLMDGWWLCFLSCRATFGSSRCCLIDHSGPFWHVSVATPVPIRFFY